MLSWKVKTQRFSTGSFGSLGELKKAALATSWNPDGVRHSTGEKDWGLFCNLPGLRDDQGRFATEEEAKVRAEELLAFWLRKAGLTHA